MIVKFVSLFKIIHLYFLSFFRLKYKNIGVLSTIRRLRYDTTIPTEDFYRHHEFDGFQIFFSAISDAQFERIFQIPRQTLDPVYLLS